MPIAAYFHPNKMTLAQFEDVHRRLVEAGASEPAGRLHHSCIGPDGDLMVYDIWDSQASFEAFGATLMPIIAEVGIDIGTPDVIEVQRMEQVAYPS
jgi:hypothetical protein